ncbi:putative F-box protein [Raphanus sativus]|nr:putative F-box protein [Raphanus sativus]
MMRMMRLWLQMMTRWRRPVMRVPKNNRTVDLPEDMLVEILSRVSEASLARVYLSRLDLHGIQDVDVYALGKSKNNEYKILRGHHHGHGYLEPCLVEYEIYDFTSNSWRVIGKTREWSIPRMWRGGTSVNGNTYWLTFTFRKNGPRSRDTLRCFDFSTERFELVSLSGDPRSYHAFALSVTREEQKLCLLTSSRDEVYDIDVWMATKVKCTGDMSWSKLLTVKRTHRYEFITLCAGMSFLADRENKVLVHPSRYKNSSNCLHILGEDKYLQVDLHDVGSKCSLPVTYGPTLVQIQQGSFGVGTWKAPLT